MKSRWGFVITSCLCAAVACSDDEAPGGGGQAGAPQGGQGGQGGTASQGGSGGAGGAGGEGGTSEGGSGGGGGAQPQNGSSAFNFVSAGDQVQSQSYQMVFTFGQSTPNQGLSTSESYQMQGGLVGANGSTP